MIDWKQFLTRWSRELLATPLADRLDSPPASPDWLGFAPAVEKDVAELEQRLGVILPPSYRAFVLTTNGWRRTTPFIARIRPAADVEWLRVEHENLVEIYGENGSTLEDEEYYQYGDNGAPYHRAEHVRMLLQISDYEDGMYLLNPQAVTPDGEWEAWFFANWVPGATRYPSFAHLMLHEYRSFAKLEKIPAFIEGLPALNMPSPTIPRIPAERVGKRRAKAPSFEQLIEHMQSTDSKVRERAVRTFCGKLKLRYEGKRSAELTHMLSDLFRSATDPAVRSACISGITAFAEEGTSPAPLFDALSDPHPGVILSGIFALSYFPDPRAWKPLCEFIESRVNVLFNESAMSSLADMSDERAVPTLAGVLFDTGTTFDQSFGTAAMALARCGPKGFDVLAKAAEHSDARIRLAATIGLDVSGDQRAIPYLDALENDPDPRVSARAKLRAGHPRLGH